REEEIIKFHLFILPESDNDSDYTPSNVEDQSPPLTLMLSQLKDFHKYFMDISSYIWKMHRRYSF
ncbi:7524_t:CDS:2, partial [Acaulospora morrowiae]